MRPARAAAWLAVAAWHGALVAALWAGQHGGAAPAGAAATALAVRLWPLPGPERAAPGVAAHRPPMLPVMAPPPAVPELALVAPPAFEVEAESPRPAGAAPAVASAVPAPVPSVPPVPPVPVAAPAEPVQLAEAPALQPARRAACAPATHPPPLRERGIEGVVRLRVWVDELGRAGQVLLAGSSGWRLFDDAAMAQARRCPFHPAQRGSQPVGSWVEFPVRFALETSNG